MSRHKFRLQAMLADESDAWALDDEDREAIAWALDAIAMLLAACQVAGRSLDTMYHGTGDGSSDMCPHCHAAKRVHEAIAKALGAEAPR
jgi:hypothetical protein